MTIKCARLLVFSVCVYAGAGFCSSSMNESEELQILRIIYSYFEDMGLPYSTSNISTKEGDFYDVVTRSTLHASKHLNNVYVFSETPFPYLPDGFVLKYFCISPDGAVVEVVDRPPFTNISFCEIE